MIGPNIFKKEKAYLAEAKYILENGSEIEVRKALSNMIYSCDEAISMSSLIMRINDDLVKQMNNED